MMNYKKIHKGICALGLAGVLASSVFSAAAFAEGPGSSKSSEEMAHLSDNTLEWYEIDGLINVYNPTVLKNRNDFSKDERRTYEASQITSYLLDKADDYESLADAMVDTNALVAATNRTTANSLRLQAESNVVDHEVLKLQYQQIEKQTAHTARTTFLNYYSALYNKENAEQSLAFLERAYQSAINRKKVGMATEIEVLSAKENLDNARAGILTTESAITSSRNALLVMCGWRYDGDGVIGPVPELGGDLVSGIQYEEDKAKAEENNLTLKMDKIKLENAKKGNYTSLVVEQNQDQLNNDTNSFGINFKAAYDGLVNAQAAYANAINDRNVGAQTLAAADKQYSLGMTSAIEHETAVNTYRGLELAEKQALIKLITARATYDDAVNGLI